MSRCRVPQYSGQSYGKLSLWAFVVYIFNISKVSAENWLEKPSWRYKLLQKRGTACGDYHLALPRSALTRGQIRMQTLVFSFSSFCSWNEISPWSSLSLLSRQLTLHSSMNNQRSKQNVDINMQAFLMKHNIIGSLGNKKYRNKMNIVLLLHVILGNCSRWLKCLLNYMLGIMICQAS